MQVTACSNIVLSTKHYYLSSFCFEGLIDVTLVDEDAYSKVIDVAADVEESCGHCLVMPEKAFSQLSGKLALFGHNSKLAYGDHCDHYGLLLKRPNNAIIMNLYLCLCLSSVW